MRIASLVPSATEMLYALGLGDKVVGVTHECDFPPKAARETHLTRSIIPEPRRRRGEDRYDGLESGEIDAAVREAVGAGRALYELDEDALRALDVDLIVTQAVCEVCAVSFDDVRAVAARLPTEPAVISLDPSRLGDVIADVGRLASAAGAPRAGAELQDDLVTRLEAVHRAVAGARHPRVAALEWLDPVFIGGHWIPEMIAAAGGIDPIGEPGAKSRTAEWGELAEAAPDLVVVMPCGWDAARARREALAHPAELASLGADRIIAVDAAASFSRPGPRLIEGTELLAHLMHPDRVPPPEGVAFEEVSPHEFAER